MAILPEIIASAATTPLATVHAPSTAAAPLTLALEAQVVPRHPGVTILRVILPLLALDSRFIHAFVDLLGGQHHCVQCSHHLTNSVCRLRTTVGGHLDVYAGHLADPLDLLAAFPDDAARN